TGGDGFTFDVENFCAWRNAAAGSHALDPVVFDDDVGVLQDFIAFHRDHRRAAQNDRALGSFTRQFQINRNLLNVLFLFLELLWLFFFLFVLFVVFLGFGGLFLFLVLIGVLAVALFLFAFLLFILGRFKGNSAERLAKITCP